MVLKILLSSLRPTRLKLKHFFFCLISFVSVISLGSQSTQNFLPEDFQRCYNKVVSLEFKGSDVKQMYLDSCKLIASTLNSDFYYGKYYLQKGNFHRTTHTDSSIFYIEKSIDKFSNYQDSVIFVEAQFTRANIFIFTDAFFSGIAGLNETIQSIDIHFDLYSAADKAKIRLIRAKCLASIGIVYERFGDQELAIQYFFKSLKSLEFIETKESILFKCSLLANIGLSYSGLEDYEQSEFYITKSIDLKKSAGLPGETGFNYRILGINCVKKGNHDLALKYLNIADKLFAENKEEKEIHKNTFWRGKCHFAANEYKNAKVFFTGLLEPFESNFTKNDVANLHEELALVCDKLEEINESNAHFQKALQLRKEIRTSEDRNAFEEFLVYFNAQETLFDERLRIVKNQQVREQLAMKIEASEEKRNWLYLIFGVVTILLLIIIILIANAFKRNKRINSDLEQSVQNQETLFKEVHHRVKNNFQIISSLLNLQSVNEEEEKSKEALSEAKSRIQSMSLVHEMLYRKGNLSRINFKDYCAELITTILESYNLNDRVAYKIIENDLSDFQLDVAIPLGLIMNEAITNSIKHAFEDVSSPQIVLELNQTSEGLFEIIIGDNGRGFNSEQHSRETESDSLGLELITILAEQIDGTAKIESENGTKITLTFNPENKV